MVAGLIADTYFRIEEIVGLVDVQTLILVCTVLLLDEFVVDTVRSVANVPVLEVSKDGEMLAKLPGGLDKRAVVILSGVGIIIGVATVVEIRVVQAGKSRIMIDHIFV